MWSQLLEQLLSLHRLLQGDVPLQAAFDAINPNPDPDPNPSPNPPNPNSPGGWQLTATQHQGRLEDGSVSWCYTIAPKLGWGGGSEAKQYSTAGWLAALPVFEPHYQVKP